MFGFPKKYHRIARGRTTTVCLLLASLVGVSSAGAATIVGSVGPELPSVTTYDLTALGTRDWAYWALEPNPTTGIPTNSKSGADLIGSATALGGGSVRGSTTITGAVPENRFTFSDGTSTVSNTTGVLPTGVFNTQLVTSAAGVRLSVDLPAVETYTVYVWVSAFALNSSTFTASLTGATSFVSTAIADVQTTSTKDTYLITLTVTPDSPGDDLLISAVAGSSGGANSHILISGLAVASGLIPEPAATGALAGLAALCGVLARRRSR